MSYLNCPCGQEIHDTEAPSPNKALLIFDHDRDAITDYRSLIDVDIIDADDLEERSREVWRCWSCGRLHVETEPGSNTFEVYSRTEATRPPPVG